MARNVKFVCKNVETTKEVLTTRVKPVDFVADVTKEIQAKTKKYKGKLLTVTKRYDKVVTKLSNEKFDKVKCLALAAGGVLYAPYYVNKKGEVPEIDVQRYQVHGPAKGKKPKSVFDQKYLIFDPANPKVMKVIKLSEVHRKYFTAIAPLVELLYCREVAREYATHIDKLDEYVKVLEKENNSVLTAAKTILSKAYEVNLKKN